MGRSVWSEVDTNKYFSISTIDKTKMAKYGINMSIKQLRDLARETAPFTEILTGQSKAMGYRRRTKIYRYEDFIGGKTCTAM